MRLTQKWYVKKMATPNMATIYVDNRRFICLLSCSKITLHFLVFTICSNCLTETEKLFFPYFLVDGSRKFAFKLLIDLYDKFLQHNPHFSWKSRKCGVLIRDPAANECSTSNIRPWSEQHASNDIGSVYWELHICCRKVASKIITYALPYLILQGELACSIHGCRQTFWKLCKNSGVLHGSFRQKIHATQNLARTCL